MKSLENNVVWITGASSGIGEAMANQFAKEGAKLVLSARRTEELERVKKGTGLPADEVLVLPMDMEQFGNFDEAVEKVIAHFGRIDILVNNAGISQRGHVLLSNMDVYQKLINLNYLAVVALTKAVLPVFNTQKSGHFVAISSISGKLGSPMRAGYAASKHALHGFFDALRSEVTPDNIKVTLVCPGYIKTNISLNALGNNGELHGKMDSNQENGLSPERCAEKICKGIKNNKSELYIGGKEVMGVYLKRFFPKILERILLNQAPK
jgi:short-subunit dehydrogenase